MANFGELSSGLLARELGTDDSTRLFTDARRKAAVNQGALEFADLTECLKRQSTISCSNGVREYDLLSTVNVPGGDFLRLSPQRPEFQFVNDTGVVTYVSGEAFPRRDVEWLNQFAQGWRSSTGGTPSAYYERVDGGRRYFGLDTPPTIDSSESAKVVLPYIAKPQVMTSDTDVPFTWASTATGASTGSRGELEPYHQAIVHYAASQLEKLRVNTEASQSQLQIFLGYVERFMQKQMPKGGQMVKPARSYFNEVRARRNGNDSPSPMSGWNWS